MRIAFTPEQLACWQNIAVMMRAEHDAGDGYFSTEEVDMVERFVENIEEGMKQDTAKARTKKRKL